MQLTRAGEYAVLGVLYLAQEPETVTMLTQVAEAEEVPESFLRKIFRQLRQKGIVAAQRGRSGGFRLARPPDQISVLEVVEAIEGPITLNVCIMGVAACPRVKKCPLHEVWMKAHEALRSVLGAATLADLVARRRTMVQRAGS
jgi:Rrf2 family iron-sulfur cluster assembly transcriptional regulator